MVAGHGTLICARRRLAVRDGGGLGAPTGCEFLSLRVLLGSAVALQPQWLVRIAWLDLAGLDRFTSQSGIERSTFSTSGMLSPAGASRVVPWSRAVVYWASGGSWKLAGPAADPPLARIIVLHVVD